MKYKFVTFTLDEQPPGSDRWVVVKEHVEGDIILTTFMLGSPKRILSGLRQKFGLPNLPREMRIKGDMFNGYVFHDLSGRPLMELR